MKSNNWIDGPCYYVSAIDAGRVAIIAGPFKTHQEAKDQVNAARRTADAIDPRAHFYAFGTCKMQNGHTEGKLNTQMGI